MSRGAKQTRQLELLWYPFVRGFAGAAGLREPRSVSVYGAAFIVVAEETWMLTPWGTASQSSPDWGRLLEWERVHGYGLPGNPEPLEGSSREVEADMRHQIEELLLPLAVRDWTLQELIEFSRSELPKLGTEWAGLPKAAVLLERLVERGSLD